MFFFSICTAYAVQTPALRAVGNIATGDDVQTEVVVSLGVLNRLKALLDSPKRGTLTLQIFLFLAC